MTALNTVHIQVLDTILDEVNDLNNIFPSKLERSITSNKWLLAASNMVTTGKKSVVVSQTCSNKRRLYNTFHILHHIDTNIFKTEIINLPIGMFPECGWCCVDKDDPEYVFSKILYKENVFGILESKNRVSWKEDT